MQFWRWYSRMATKEHCFTKLLPKPALIRFKIILQRKAVTVPFLIQKKPFGYCCSMLHTGVRLHGFWTSCFFSTALMFPEMQNTLAVTAMKTFIFHSDPCVTPRLCWWLNKKTLKLMFKPPALSTPPPTDACSPLSNRTDSSPPERSVSVLSLLLSILPRPRKDKHALIRCAFRVPAAAAAAAAVCAAECLARRWHERSAENRISTERGTANVERVSLWPGTLSEADWAHSLSSLRDCPLIEHTF